MGCEYSNACSAGLAGFNTKTECTSAIQEALAPLGASPEAAIECPVGEGMCTMEYNPIKCGVCEYSNPCGAELAGFSPKTECTSALPQCPPMGEGMCTMEYMPVKCGELECEYSNACNAGIAGFNPETECTSALPQCPPMGEGVCTMEYMPVKCGDMGCEYSNACSAGLAGFNTNTECTSAIQEALAPLGASPEAAIECPVGEGMCTMEYNPIKCGVCEYSNPCGAEFAGFNPETDCVTAVVPECPIAGEGMCTMEYMPVKCGELECEYPNACNAGFAGFNAETECASVIPAEEGTPELYTATNGEATPTAEDESSLNLSEEYSSATTLNMAAGSLVAVVTLLMA